MLEKFSQIDVTIGTEPFQLYSMKDLYSEFANHYEQGDGFEEPPLYGILWPSAEALAFRLWQDHRHELPGQTVLELGCGLALPSLLCARLGAKTTAMDNHRNFEAILAENLARNRITCAAAVGSFADADLELGKFDWIVGSDILYEPDNYLALERFILQHANPGARVLIADPGRYAAGNFGESLKTKGQFKKSDHALATGQVVDLYAWRLP